MWIAMRSHTLPMSSNRFWLLSTQRCCGPCSCWLWQWNHHHHTVKSSDGLTDRNDREDQLWRLALLATELSSHDDYYQHVHYGNTARTKRPTAIQASCNLILLAIACCMTILLPMCHWIAGLGARRILGDKSLKLRNVQPSAKMAWVYHISSIAAMCVQALHGWFVCLNNIPMMILFEHIFFQKKKLEMTIIIFIVNAIWSKWSPFLLSMMSFKKPSPTK